MIYTIILIAIILTLIYMRFETTFLARSVLNFSTNTKGLRIVHLSDIHINKFYVSEQKLLTYLRQADPDIIIMSGDYIETVKDIPKFINFLEAISNNFPVYLTLGNHDHKALHYDKKTIADFVKAVEATGATVLINSSIRIAKEDITYNLIGIDDLKHGNPDNKKAFKEIKPSFDSGIINIIFSHNPDIIFALPRYKVDYFFCGHFHGGQIWMPFNLEFRLMRKEKLSKMGYYRGLHKVNGINIYINRGMGNVIFPFRFFSTPEMAIIQLPASTKE